MANRNNNLRNKNVKTANKNQNDNPFFESVKRQIDEWDPIALLAIDAPRNEYDLESKEIATRLRRNSTTPEISAVLSEVFSGSFDQTFSPEKCRPIAEKIKNAIDVEGK